MSKKNKNFDTKAIHVGQKPEKIFGAVSLPIYLTSTFKQEEFGEYEYDYSNDAMAGMDDYIASELDYQTNYIKKDLEKIADYYEISKRKKNFYSPCFT